MRLEQTLSPAWLENGGWDVQAGLRELLQNARDEQVCNGRQMTLRYWPKSKTLLISTENAELDRETLLLGNSTKRDDSESIGGFGTGYKLAALALASSGYGLTLQNGAETWSFAIEDSKTYGTEVLTVRTRKRKTPSESLTWQVHGVTEDDVAEMAKRTLFLKREGNDFVFDEEYRSNRVLKGDRARMVFVKGLFVFKMPKKNAKFGYDFLELKLDESRKMADPWNFDWKRKELLVEESMKDEEVRERLIDAMVDRKVRDEEGFDGQVSEFVVTNSLIKMMIDRFREKHPEAVFVPDGNEYLTKQFAKIGVATCELDADVWRLAVKVVPDPYKLLDEMGRKAKRVLEPNDKQAERIVWFRQRLGAVSEGLIETDLLVVEMADASRVAWAADPGEGVMLDVSLFDDEERLAEAAISVASALTGYAPLDCAAKMLARA